MKFGHEYSTALANEGFPQEWVDKAISYKHLKKCIKKVQQELEQLGLDQETLQVMSGLISQPLTPGANGKEEKELFFSAVKPHLTSIPEEFSPQLRILVDSKTGTPLDARLAPETRESLRKLARHELVVDGRNGHAHTRAVHEPNPLQDEIDATTSPDARWVQVPLASANDFFEMLEPKLQDLETLREDETHNLEELILDLGSAVENVVQPVREGFETRREMSYRDLYFWREMFRLYLETPIFYNSTEQRRGALTFTEAKSNLEKFDEELRSTGLLAKMRTPQAKLAAQQFLDLNVQILSIMHFQEMNARAMTKILKKFNKQTHLEGQQFIKGLKQRYPLMLSASNSGAGTFADSIARDLHTEIGTKVLSIVPQLDDWICPVCYGMAWRPVNLGCCRSVFCISCIIHLQDEGMKKCPMCNSETILSADGRNIDFETMAFLEKYFPMEAKKRQKENERANLIREHGEEFVKPACCVM
jgi:rubrerythrin